MNKFQFLLIRICHLNVVINNIIVDVPCEVSSSPWGRGNLKKYANFIKI